MDFKKQAVTILVVLTLASAGAAYYFYTEATALKNDPDKVTREETESLVAKVGKLIVLPDGETPTIATVADPEKLKDQAFFARSKKGDKVLLYANAKKAILYDEENNKIVEVAPINIGNSSRDEDEE